MIRFFETLSRNVDAVALAVVCLVLGVARQNPVTAAVHLRSVAPLGIHWTCPASDRALANLRPPIAIAIPDLPEPPSPSELDY